MKLIHSSNEKVILELPYPPSINKYYGQSGGRKYILPEGREFRRNVKDFLNEVQPFKFEIEQLVMVAEIHRADMRTKYDCDNVLKCLCDSLSAIKDKKGVVNDWYVWRDDSQAKFMLPIKGDVWKDNKCTQIAVMRSDTEEAQRITSVVRDVFAVHQQPIASPKNET